MLTLKVLLSFFLEINYTSMLDKLVLDTTVTYQHMPVVGTVEVLQMVELPVVVELQTFV